MKKILLSLTMLAGVFSLVAQPTGFDALKLSQTDIVGSARYMGMAGAFGALGGDPSAVKDNPGGLGVYRSSEISTTFNIQNQLSNASWDGRSTNSDLFKFGFTNFSYVMSWPTYATRKGSTSGLLQSNFSFAYNRLKNFNRHSLVRGNESLASISDFMANYSVGISENSLIDFDYDDYSYDWMPWISVLAYDSKLMVPTAGDNWQSILNAGETVLPEYSIYERGYMDEYTFGWGGNVSNKFFFGASLGLQTIDYSMTSRYIEDFGSNEYLDLENTLYTSGVGFNFNVGVIFRPINLIRIGVAYRTPTVFSLQDSNRGDMMSGINFSDGYKTSTPSTATSYVDYRLRKPGQFTGSLGFILGKRAIISTDVIYTHYPNMRLANNAGNAYYYDEENQSIKNIAKGGLTIKIGGEVRVTDHLFVRAGVAAATAVNNPDEHLLVRDNTKRTDMEYFHHKGTSYFTAGLGYRGNFFYFDAAFVNKNVTQDFYPYNLLEVTPATIKVHNFDLVATVGFKF